MDLLWQNGGDEQREANWWAITQPGVTMTWPIVMFNGEVVYCEWKCIDDETEWNNCQGKRTGTDADTEAHAT